MNSSLLHALVLFILATILLELIEGKLSAKITRLFQKIPERLRNYLKHIFNTIIIIIVSILNSFSVLFSRSIRYCINKPFIAISIFLCLFIFLWGNIAMDRNISYTIFTQQEPKTVLFLKLIFSYFGYLNYNDKITVNFISLGTKAITVLLSICLTFYIFTNREQRSASLSLSSNIARNALFLFYIFIAILSIFYGTLLSNVLQQTLVSSNDNLYYSYFHFKRVIIWMILFSISTYLSLRSIIVLFKNINIRWVITVIINQTSKTLFTISFTVSPFLRKRLYDDLYINVESIYQLLTISVEKNLDELYARSFTTWRDKVLVRLNHSRLPVIDDVPLYICLNKVDLNCYSELYRLIIKNHISLIMKLYQNHKLKEMHDCINTFYDTRPRDIIPTSKKLYGIFITAYHELAMLMYKDNNVVGLEIILNYLEDMSREVEEDDLCEIMYIYKDLILRTIKNNDVKTLTSVSYSLVKGIGQNKILHPCAPVDINKDFVNKIINFLEKTQVNHKITNEFLLGSVYILLQGSLKSIELSHYACVGFLTKFIVTNFLSDIVNKAFSKFTARDCVNDPFIKKRNEHSKIRVFFSVNQKVTDYCIKKQAILIYAQQKYAVVNNLDFGNVPNTFIDVAVIKCSYIDYIFKKINKSRSKYGLLFLEDNKYMKKVEEEINYNIRFLS